MAASDSVAPVVNGDNDEGRVAYASVGDRPRQVWSLMLIRCARRSAALLIGVGACIAIVAGSLRPGTTEDLGTPQGFFNSLSSPLLVLAIGIALRIVIAPVALLAAGDVVWTTGAHLVLTGDPRSGLSRLLDRYHVANSYRSLRWSAATRVIARSRLGGAGRFLWLLEAALRTLAWTSVGVALILLLALGSDA
ncbi:MAG: hypothetical protein KDC39_10170 [Actinobacteria bacterium]|nr:hypothetical protein [Actinomycetota bacterium]